MIEPTEEARKKTEAMPVEAIKAALDQALAMLNADINTFERLQAGRAFRAAMDAEDNRK